MALSVPKLVPGWIYCIREEDYLDGSIGRFVKLGLTKRTVPIRIREHQTGNPRKEVSEYDLYLEMMDYAETYLHHYFAQDRIGGEWFDMDNAKVLAEVAPLLQTLEAEMAVEKPNFIVWSNLKTTRSNGNVIGPTPAVSALHQSYILAEENHTIAEARHKIHDNNLRALVGTNDGIEGVLTLIENNKSDSFNKDDFTTLVTAAQLAQCDDTKTTFKGNLIVESGRNLATLDPVLDAQLTASAGRITVSPNLTNLTNAETPLIQSIKDEHMAYLGTLRQLKEAEWECYKLKAQIVVALGANQGITGVVTWRRYDDTKTAFSAKKAKELFPTEYNNSLRPVQNTVSVKIHRGRKYNP